jgi:hypothetical protein
MTMPNPLNIPGSLVAHIVPANILPNVKIGQFSHCSGENFEARITPHHDSCCGKLISAEKLQELSASPANGYSGKAEL